MGKVGIALLFGVLGLLGGALLIGPLIGGAMMGAGAGSGLTLGTCSTVKAAQELGYLTPEQVDETLTRAAEDMGGQALAEDQQIVGSAAACDEALANILSEGEQ
ncbi:hypothetical protein K3163_05515 [Qipengyuania sp. 1NDW9]|uniref:hypothetical protein n=1 Tax=Qipengyuania xiapuensis TaxID=2867236 RepID=UPI001C87B845|nr:hypothetical protein [Qipengyuania xiapuensis]MBX7492660.1 hypothetical protein [Qipengyuania xiapuensis]